MRYAYTRISDYKGCLASVGRIGEEVMAVYEDVDAVSVTKLCPVCRCSSTQQWWSPDAVICRVCEHYAEKKA